VHEAQFKRIDVRSPDAVGIADDVIVPAVIGDEDLICRSGNLGNLAGIERSIHGTTAKIHPFGNHGKVIIATKVFGKGNLGFLLVSRGCGFLFTTGDKKNDQKG